MHGFLELLERVYSHSEFAFLVTVFLLLTAIGIGGWQSYRDKAYLSAARDAEEAIRKALGDSKDPAEQRLSFAQNYHEVDAVLRQSANKPGAEALARAWGEFREGIIDETETPIRNTSRRVPFSTERHHISIDWPSARTSMGTSIAYRSMRYQGAKRQIP